MPEVCEMNRSTYKPIVWLTGEQVHVQVREGVAMDLVVEFHGSIQPVNHLGHGHRLLPKGCLFVGHVEGLDCVDLGDDAHIAKDGDFGIGGYPGAVQVGDGAVGCPEVHTMRLSGRHRLAQHSGFDQAPP
jgi:hypothetical protein